MAALSASLLAIPLWGQRAGRGGMAMGVARGGYATHGSGFVGASRGGYWGGGYTFRGHYPYHPRRYPYFYPWRYPWGFRGYGAFPWSWGWSGVGWLGPGDDPFPAQSYPMDASTPADNSSAFFAYQQQQIDRLNDEVARLHAQLPTPAPANAAPEPAEIRASTVLVFGDHHSEEIQNYAIVDGTLWVFNQQRARKIPIAQLNVPATTKANADRGIDFRLPGH